MSARKAGPWLRMCVAIARWQDEILLAVGNTTGKALAWALVDKKVTQDLSQNQENRMGLTSDRNDPRLGYGSDTEPTGQNEIYLVLSDDELARGFVRPVRNAYKHLTCGSVTTMGQKLSETYAADPSFYGATFCCRCNLHRPVGAYGEFDWLDGSKVGT